MPKHSNLIIRDSHHAAQILSSLDLEYQKALAFYNVVELLAPNARIIEAEKGKFVLRHGLNGIPPAELESSPATQSFLDDYGRFLSLDQEVPKLPVVTVASDELRGLKIKGQLLGALRRIGVLVIAEPSSSAAEAPGEEVVR